jgi:transposase
MARFKETNNRQGQFIPIIFDEQILPGTIEHAICNIIDHHLDLSVFDARYKNDMTGAPAVPPSILLKIILVCYSKGIFASRRMEQAVRTNVTLMAVAEGLTPDHATIAGFVSSLGDVVKRLFVDILIRCAQLELIGGEVFALDGCKLASNASKEYSGTFEELRKKKKKLEAVLSHILAKHKEEDMSSGASSEQVKKYEDKINKIDSFLTSHEPKKGSRKREVKSNVTDNESAKMKSSHGIIQGYNGMAMVDDKTQVIVAAEAYGQGQEHDLLVPLVEQTESNLKETGNRETMTGATVIADTNYFSEDNCRYCEDEKLDAYIPDHYFRNRDPRFADRQRHKPPHKNLFTQTDFSYDENGNCYSCPTGNRLRYLGKACFHGNHGRRYIIANAEKCALCHLAGRCLKKGAKVRHLFITDVPRPKTYSDRMMTKIDSSHGRDMYSRRMGIVEPVFANIKIHKGLYRFTLRTKKKVNVQWLLFCMIHNIGKIAKCILFYVFSMIELIKSQNRRQTIPECAHRSNARGVLVPE